MESIQSPSGRRYIFTAPLVQDPEHFRYTYLAEDPENQDRFFVTVLPKNSGLDGNSITEGFNHKNIPVYIDSFPYQDSFFLVRKFVEGVPLSKFSLISSGNSLQNARKIGLEVLDFLSTIQDGIRPVAHGHICPDSIWVASDQSSKEIFRVYVLGFSHSESLNITATNTSVAWKSVDWLSVGIPGEANPLSVDLYCLGVMLGCVACKIPFSSVFEFSNQDQPFQFGFRDKIIDLNIPLADFLYTLSNPDLNKRFSSPRAALQTLKAIDLSSRPEISVTPSTLDINLIPNSGIVETFVRVNNKSRHHMLKGKVRMKSHPGDYCQSQSDRISWIFFQEESFSGSSICLKLLVDTNYLRPKTVYYRELEVWSNARQASLTIPVTVRAGELNKEFRKAPIPVLILFWLLFAIVPIFPHFFQVTTHETGILVDRIFRN